jgi:hypothetical protein
MKPMMVVSMGEKGRVPSAHLVAEIDECRAGREEGDRDRDEGGVIHARSPRFKAAAGNGR